MFEYNANDTVPVGDTAVLSKVAVSPNVPDTPAVPTAGLATVVMCGLAGLTTICSPVSVQGDVNGSLLVSPTYDACQ